MNIQGWAEIVVTIGLAVGLGWPLGIYMARVWEGQPTWLDPVFRPIEAALARTFVIRMVRDPPAPGGSIGTL